MSDMRKLRWVVSYVLLLLCFYCLPAVAMTGALAWQVINSPNKIIFLGFKGEMAQANFFLAWLSHFVCVVLLSFLFLFSVYTLTGTQSYIIPTIVKDITKAKRRIPSILHSTDYYLKENRFFFTIPLTKIWKVLLYNGRKFDGRKYQMEIEDMVLILQLLHQLMVDAWLSNWIWWTQYVVAVMCLFGLDKKFRIVGCALHENYPLLSRRSFSSFPMAICLLLWFAWTSGQPSSLISTFNSKIGMSSEVL